MELLLIRHALPVRRELEHGPADPELAPAGRAQAVHLAGYLAAERLDALFTSPLLRARETAAPLAERQGIDAHVVDGLAEYDRHHHEYIPIEELKASGDPRWDEMVAGTYGRDPNVSPEMFQQAVVSTIEELIEAHPGAKIAAVCHGGVLSAYLAHVLGVANATGFFYPNYTSIHRVLAARSGQRQIITINETSHLRGTGLPIGMHS